MAQDEAYRRAEKKIEQARRSGATELDLSRMGLTALPESLAQPTKLRRIDASHKRLTSASESDTCYTRHCK